MGIRSSNNRAQAAIEFLITNGWAILVVVILLAVLFYIGVLSPQNTTPNTCLFQPGFSCYTFKVGNGTGSLELDFGQATGRSIQVTGISCSQNSTAALHTSPLAEDITVPSGEHRWIAGGTSNNSGIICEGATGVAGSRYKGTVCINYIESSANAQRLICGDINARLEPASTLQPTGSPTPTPYPTPPPGALNITECGQVYSQPGYYYLDSDLNDTDGSHCIHMTADASNSILDCYGHTLSSTNQWTGIGIYLQNTASNITVRHCVITNFSMGILMESSNYDTITDNTINSNSEGIYMYAASTPGNNNIIAGNTINSNGDTGIYMQTSTYTNVTGNTIDSNANYGIVVVGSSNDNILTGNTVMGNGNIGIYADSGSSNNLLTGNTACWNYNNNLYCDVSQTDGNGNICTPYGGTVCSGSITCNPTCPPLPPPDCAPGWVVSSCGCVLSVPGDYTLGSDLTETLGGDCLGITANDAKLDCRGHSITGQGAGNGIYLYNPNTGSISEVTVQNCRVSNFSTGIFAQSMSGSAITGNNVSSNTNSLGIYVQSSNDNNFTGNTANSNGEGIYLYSSNNNNITGNTANSNADCGLIVMSSSGNNLTDNTANQNANLGIYLSGSDSTTLTTNTACWNMGDVYCDSPQNDGNGNICMPEGSTACLDSITCNSGCPAPEPPACAPGWVVSSCECVLGVPGNYTLGTDLTETQGVNCISITADDANLDCQHHRITNQNGGSGIALYNPNTNSISGVTVENCDVSNFSSAIYAYGMSDSVIRDSNFSSNGVGIYFTGACDNNTISGNTIKSNTDGGIILVSSNNNNITDNTANSDYGGIELSSSNNNTISGNTANSNTYKGIYLDSSSNDNNLVDNNACSNLYGDLYCDSGQIDNGGNNCNIQAGCGITCGSECPAPQPPSCASGYVVNSCPCALYPAGTYTLNSNLTLDGNNYCITIPPASNGTTLNCQHHSISGSPLHLGYPGIFLSGVSGVTVENCGVSNFYDGLYLWGSSNNTFTGNDVSSNILYGLYFYSSSNNNFTDNSMCSNPYGDLYCDSSQADNGGNNCNTQANCGITCGSGCPAPEPPACASGYVVNSCPCTLWPAGAYTLDSDLTLNGNNDCITIPPASSGSTLDCQHHSLSGQGNYAGINLDGVSGVSVYNCNVNHFGFGIILRNSNGSSILNSNVSSNNEGIYMLSSNGSDITGNTANSNSYGIYLDNHCDSNTISGNTANSNSNNGIWLSSSNSNNIITGNTANSNDRGIELSASTNNDLTGNTANSNQYGIFLTPSSNSNNFAGNTADSNSRYGIYVWSSNNNNITDNNANSNGIGIYLYQGSSGNNITGNTANSNNIGIYLDSSNMYNILTGNTVSSNNYGIFLDSSSNNNFTGNTANSNNDFYCISSPTNNDLGGNTCGSKDSCNWICSCPTNTCP